MARDRISEDLLVFAHDFDRAVTASFVDEAFATSGIWACLVGALPKKRRLSLNRRRALELLANSLDGATKDSLVLVHGISPDTIAGLVRTGLATARHEAAKADSRTISTKRYRITNAGRMALEGWPAGLVRPPR